MESMSKASLRNHARQTRRVQRARHHLHQSSHGRKFLERIKFFGLAADAGFSMSGVHIKAFDVSQVVDENLSERVNGYSPSSDSGKKMCSDLNICGGVMNGFLIETAAKLHKLGWTFTYDGQFEAAAEGKDVIDFKVMVSGNTQ